MDKFDLEILRVLAEEKMKWRISDIKPKLLERGYKEEYRGHLDVLKSKLYHSCDALADLGMVIKIQGHDGSGTKGWYVGITPKGLDEIKRLHRLWRWVKNELYQLLLILSLTIGLLAFFGIDWQWLKNTIL